LILIPRHGRAVCWQIDHGNAAVDGTDDLAKIAPHAILFPDFGDF
jgi:hypothetical protein